MRERSMVAPVLCAEMPLFAVSPLPVLEITVAWDLSGAVTMLEMVEGKPEVPFPSACLLGQTYPPGLP